ncbi:MAG: M48 family metalloprotease [Candidatus Methylomirabilales bacterium]
MTDDEREIWQKALIEEQRLAKSGRLFQDPLLEDYLRHVGGRLIPEAAKREPQVAFRFAVVMDPTLNAFAYPNGMIVIHSGLLARLENEAQLACVLSHEIIHVTQRHAGILIREAKTKAVGKALAGAVLSLPLGSIGIRGGYSAATALLNLLRGHTSGRGLLKKADPIIGLGMELALIFSISGYGEEMEQEADVLGMDLLVRAGYDPREIPKVFALLMDTYGDRADVEMFFLGYHPANAERLKTANRLLETVYQDGIWQEDWRTNAEEFLKRTRLLVRENAVLDIELGRYNTAKTQFERVLRLSPADPKALYYLGELYRRRGEHGDIAEAHEAYRRALSSDPSYADPHKGLGLLYYRMGKRQKAKVEFTKYLQQLPLPKDAGVIKDYLLELQ